MKSAFLFGLLDEEIYMEQPEGYVVKGQEHKVVRLKKALYGLKQASRTWWKTLDKSMTKLGFKRIYSDSGIFIHRDKKSGKYCIACIYVDDVFLGPDRNLL